MLLIPILIFIASLALLVKGADWLLESAEKIGLVAGLSPFIVGVTIVGLGTSFPELISSLFAVFQGVTEIVTANAIGSNIANILLVVGISAVIGRKLVVTKSLIDIDLPLLAISTILFAGIIWDAQITIFESILLLITYGVYLLYTVLHRDESEVIDDGMVETLPSRVERRGHVTGFGKKGGIFEKPKIVFKDFVFLLLGIIGLAVGAKFLIDSVIELSDILNIGAGVIAITAVALGTSLPELLVSAKAAWKKKSEVALGNIFGSNVFNLLVVVGIPGLVKTLKVDNETFSIGLPVLLAATFLFIISGISRRIHIWEGMMYLIVYLFFIGKLFSFF